MNNLSAQTAYVGGTEIKQVRKGDRLVLAPNGDKLWYDSNELPSLDLRFASNKSLVDATTGSNLVDFTRASSGTYVGSDGLVKTAVTNLLLQSEDFSTTWSVTNATLPPIDGLAPDGGSAGNKVVSNNGSFGYLLQDSPSLPLTGSYTYSIYAKSGEWNWLTLWVYDGTGATTYSFNLDAGSSADGTITAVGNGWYRCSKTVTLLGGTASGRVRLYPNNQQGPSVTVGDGTSGIYLWGAQLEQSSTVGEYVKTTSTINSAPRFDHDPATGESLGLLVEESRTNLSPYSRYENGQWTFSAASIGTSTKTAVDGETITAFLTDTSTAPHRVNRSVSGAYTAGTVVTLSFYVAKPSNSDIRGLIIRLRTAAGGQSVAVGVSDDGDNSVYTFASSSPFGASPPPAITSGSFSAVPVGNKWTRISIVTQVSSANTNYTQWDIGFSTALSSDTGTGTANSELFIDAVQLEAGSFPTSYIPTTSSTVTRVADVASISGSNFSGWFNESEGSLYTAASFIGAVSQTSFIAQAALNGANYISTYRDGSPQRLTARVVAAGVDSAFFYTTASAIQADVEYRNCVGYKLNDFAATSNGAVPAGDLAGNVPTGLTTLGLGGSPYTSSVPLNGHIRRLTYWPVRLPNETLQTITQ